jgi:hypothetical protein
MVQSLAATWLSQNGPLFDRWFGENITAYLAALSTIRKPLAVPLVARRKTYLHARNADGRSNAAAVVLEKHSTRPEIYLRLRISVVAQCAISFLDSTQERDFPRWGIHDFFKEMNTQRLYYEDPYLQLCEAEVLAVNPIDEAKAGVILSRTCFFPRGGGAQGDTGSLGDVSVSEAITDRLTGMILHLIAIERRESLGVGERVVCRIDWNTRYRVMRLHSASHVMEHYLFELARGLELVGTNLNEERDSSTYSADPSAHDPHIP